MSRSKSVLLQVAGDVQAPARDAVRAPLSSMPKRVVNFAIQKELQTGEAATTTALRPAKTTVPHPPSAQSPFPVIIPQARRCPSPPPWALDYTMLPL